jgi:hypothetical protein
MADLAAASPRDFMSSDPLMDAWGPADERPPMLYLDKCWRNLQVVLAPHGAESARPAYELVRGEVTMHESGWDPFIRYLDAATVQRIAEDLADVDECQVMDGIAEGRRRSVLGKDFETEVDYTIEYLTAAVEFTSGLSRTESGLVYLIG